MCRENLTAVVILLLNKNGGCNTTVYVSAKFQINLHLLGLEFAPIHNRTQAPIQRTNTILVKYLSLFNIYTIYDTKTTVKDTKNGGYIQLPLLIYYKWRLYTTAIIFILLFGGIYNRRYCLV